MGAFSVVDPGGGAVISGVCSYYTSTGGFISLGYSLPGFFSEGVNRQGVISGILSIIVSKTFISPSNNRNEGSRSGDADTYIGNESSTLCSSKQLNRFMISSTSRAA